MASMNAVTLTNRLLKATTPSFGIIRSTFALRITRHGFHVSSKRGASQNFQSIEKCPNPECQCAAMPSGLEIDHETSLAGKCPLYDQHVVILTGRSDWPSRIEDDESRLIRKVREALKPGGSCYHPARVPLLSASSLTPGTSGKMLSGIAIYRPFARILGSPGLNAATLKSRDLREPLEQYENALLSSLARALDTEQLGTSPKWTTQGKGGESAAIFICGHGSRDNRCGILGPLLEREFSESLKRNGIKNGNIPMIDVDHPNAIEPSFDGHMRFSELQPFPTMTASHSLISHIGGHKFAGNVIVNIPSRWTFNTALEGCSLWYGRVEPRHVEGIVQKTLVDGVIIKELFRGGIDKHGKLIAL